MLNISRQIYAASNGSAAVGMLEEAEIIPDGKSTNEKKKLSNSKTRYKKITELSNPPLPGFTLFKPDRKSYGSMDQTWLVIDPRGFLVRISNENLSDILSYTGITEGLIQERCVWAREDTQTRMMLVPISSPKYIDAEENTVLLEEKVSVKDIQIGDEVFMQNGKTGIYMGVINLYGCLQTNPYSADPYKLKNYLRRHIIKISDKNVYFHQTDPKILKITKRTSTPGTREESVAELNNAILTNSHSFTAYTDGNFQTLYSSLGVIRLASLHAVAKVEMELIEITKDEAEVIYTVAENFRDQGQLVVVDGQGRMCVIEHTYSRTTGKPFTISELLPLTVGTRYTEFMPKYEKTRWGNNNITTAHRIDTLAKFYKVVKHVKNETYI